MEDQPNPEVGGSVERAGLSGSHRFFFRPRGKRPFPQVITFGDRLFHIGDFTAGFELAVVFHKAVHSVLNSGCF